MKKLLISLTMVIVMVFMELVDGMIPTTVLATLFVLKARQIHVVTTNYLPYQKARNTLCD